MKQTKSNSPFGDCNVEEMVECQDSSQIEYVKYIQKNLLNLSFHSLRLIPAAQYSITRNIWLISCIFIDC